MSLLQGCSILIGNVRVEEKSDDYSIMDLGKNPDWKKIGADKNSTDMSDLTFQSKKNSSIISLNSVCRETGDDNPAATDLKAVTHELLLGISNISDKTEKEITVSDTPALETTVQGQLNNQAMKLRAVVLRKNSCVYDLMYIARPERFNDDIEVFQTFTQSLVFQ
jgi:hypothetical protein